MDSKKNKRYIPIGYYPLAFILIVIAAFIAQTSLSAVLLSSELIEAEKNLLRLEANNIATNIYHRPYYIERLNQDIFYGRNVHIHDIGEPIKIRNSHSPDQDIINKAVSNSKASIFLGRNNNDLFGWIKVSDNKINGYEIGEANFDITDRIIISIAYNGSHDSSSGQEFKLFLVPSGPGNGNMHAFWGIGDTYQPRSVQFIETQLVAAAYIIDRTEISGFYEIKYKIRDIFRDFSEDDIDIGMKVFNGDLKASYQSDTTEIPSFGNKGEYLPAISTDLKALIKTITSSTAKIELYDSKNRLRISHKSKKDTDIKSDSSVFRNLLEPYITNVLKISDIASMKVDILSDGYPLNGKILGSIHLSRRAPHVIEKVFSLLVESLKYTVYTLLFVVFGFIFFTWRISRRVNILRSQAIDLIHSRSLRNDSLEYITDETKDVIGELSRSIIRIHKRLVKHANYIKNVPAYIRHEINNPLNNLRTTLQIVEQKCNCPDQSQRMLNAQDNIFSILNIVERMTEAAGIEESLEQEVLENVDFYQLLDAETKYINEQNHDDIVILKTSYESVYCFIRPNTMAQAVRNVLHNACRYRREGSQIVVKSQVRDTVLHTSIINYGQCIEPEKLNNIFNHMETGATGESRSRNRLGLGLYITKTVIAFHKGRVSANNLSEDDGVCINLDFPIISSITR
ncbi:MAG: hypothetical protein DBP00_03985 [gamma proteobacterium symbiont of Ctena orbiculata]|nr:MAG: hypothetical protein DBP00_03985 [gamma proteobacterium symbiont of Ctena orbiculata]